jgi:hypothetical protein
VTYRLVLKALDDGRESNSSKAVPVYLTRHFLSPSRRIQAQLLHRSFTTQIGRYCHQRFRFLLTQSAVIGSGVFCDRVYREKASAFSRIMPHQPKPTTSPLTSKSLVKFVCWSQLELLGKIDFVFGGDCNGA